MRSLFAGVAPLACALAHVPEGRASTAAVVREVDGRGAETSYSHAGSREKRRPKVTAGWRLTTSPHD